MESFDRTTRIEIGEKNFVPLARVPEYKFTEVYSFAADTETPYACALGLWSSGVRT